LFAIAASSQLSAISIDPFSCSSHRQSGSHFLKPRKFFKHFENYGWRCPSLVVLPLFPKNGKEI
jgi:hypothetical protein